MLSQEEETSFTLSFGGVEFCLAPSATVGANAYANAAAKNIMSVSTICHGEVVIDLNNFFGTLRVKDLKKFSDAESNNMALPVTETLMENEKDEDAMSIVDVDASSQNEPADAAALSSVSAPNPVEDSPSPQAKICCEEDHPPVEKTKHRRGQQKLNFFGRHGKKNQINMSETPKPNAAFKRCTAKEESEPTNRKKSRKSNKADQNETTSSVFVDLFEKESESSTTEESCRDPGQKESDTTDYNDIIEEPKNESENNEDSFAFTSLGQSMQSQDNECVEDDVCLLSIHSRKDTFTTDDEAKSKPKEGILSVSKRTRQETTAPCPRWGQTMTMIDHKRFIVYGGQTITNDTAKPLADLFVYDLMEHKWTKPVNCDGIARTWHTANFLPDRQLLLCFGGEVLSEKTGKLTTTDQVMVLDCEIMLWYPPTVTGQVPSGRSGHASCVLPETNSLVVFGGVKNGKWLNSVSILDTNRWKWATLKAVGDAPPPRSYHSATAISSDSEAAGSRIVIFGGNDGSKCFNGVHVLEATGEGKKWLWSNPKCKGNAPKPRTGHNATLLNDGTTILVYGGWDPNTEDENGDDLIFGDSFLLNTKTWTWRKGPKPRYEKSAKTNAANGGAGRVGHSAVLAGFHSVLAFGGRVPENEFVDDFQSLAVPVQH